MRSRRRSALLMAICTGWVLFLALFVLLAGPLGFPLYFQTIVITMVLSLLIYTVARGVWPDDER